MADPTVTRSYLAAEVEALEPFGFVRVIPTGKLLQTMEIARGEGGDLEVRVPGRPPVVPELDVSVRSALRDRGFTNADPSKRIEPWVHRVDEAGAAVDLALRVLTEVFQLKPGGTLDVLHGSRQAEHEAEQKLAGVRKRIERMLAEFVGSTPEKDADEDFVLRMGDVHVTVAPRAIPGGPLVVRVFAVTNVGFEVTPDLGLFLARLNFGLMFGRFALDAEHRSIWFDETLLGDHFDDEELRFALTVVSTTADEWDDRLKQMFGGATWQEVLTQRKDDSKTPPVKPGAGGGGYL